MRLLRKHHLRTDRDNLALGSATAVVAGAVNVAGVMAFFAFSSNVTGHAAIFAEELTKGRWHQTGIVLIWLLCFLGGAMLASALVDGVDADSQSWGGVLPAVLECLVIIVVGYYCDTHYQETLRETEVLVGALLVAMGLQNGLVASVSSGVVKTTHLTGLFTDLGVELSTFARKVNRADRKLRFKLRLRLTILGSYMGGAIAGGLLFVGYRYITFFAAAVVMLGVVAYDLYWLVTHRDRIVHRSPRSSYYSEPAE